MSSIYVPTRSGEKIKSIIHRADIPTPSGVGVILVAGAGGGLSGPSGLYSALGRQLSSEGITTLRLDYRLPNSLEECIEDLLDGSKFLQEKFLVDKFVCGLVFWWSSSY